MSQLPPANSPQPAPPSFRLYSPAAVAWATALGSTVAGGIVLALNYWRLGQKPKAWLTIFGGCLALILIFFAAAWLPDSIPTVAYAAAQAFTMLALTRHLLGERILIHEKAGGPMASNWKGVGIGALVGTILGIAFIAVLLGSGIGFGAFMDLQHSVDLGHEQEVYYSRGATREMAQHLGDALKAAGYFDDTQPASVFIAGSGSGREVSYIVGDGAWDNDKVVETLRTITARIADSVGGKPITMRLLDENLNEKKRVRVE